MLHQRVMFAAARLKDGRVVCAGTCRHFWPSASAEVYGLPTDGAPDAPWTSTGLLAMSVGRWGCGGCVMSDGRFAVLGGCLSSCEASVVDDAGAHWEPLPPMREPRFCFACAAVAGCIIVAGGYGCKSAEVYDDVLDRWCRLPHDLPVDGGLGEMGCALL